MLAMMLAMMLAASVRPVHTKGERAPVRGYAGVEGEFCAQTTQMFAHAAAVRCCRARGYMYGKH